MMVSFLLLGLGLSLIFIEFYLPGAILGLIGASMIVAAIALFASNASSIGLTLLFICLCAAGVAMTIRFALWRIVHAKSNAGIYLSKDQEGYQASSYDKSAIGKRGVVLSDLKPGGYISVEGKQLQAISVSGYLARGTEVEVIAGQEESLIVKLSKKET